MKFSLFWYEKATLLFALFFPVLGVLMSRRRLASGQGSVVALATLPLTATAVIFLFGLASVDDGLQIYSTSKTVANLRAPLRPLFMACLSTLLVLAGSFSRRRGGERARSMTWIVTVAPFAVLVGGFACGLMSSPWSTLPGSLASSLLGMALIGLHLLAVRLRVPPESRVIVATVFMLTVLLTWATWRLGHAFWVEE